jgi:hypothetical protein
VSGLSSYPTELIPFQPVDGADTRYGEIYKPISAHPFKEAGIKGFTPIQPFKVAKDILAQTNQCAAFPWPSLSELNDDIAPFPWADDSEYERYMAGDSISKILVLTTGPRLFFVSHIIGANDAREWRLARVAFNDSVSIYPSCTLDGRFLFEFHICHPADWCYNAVNQHYWIQFHGCEDILHPSLTPDTHLVCPSKHRMIMQSAITSCLFGNGSTLHTLIHISMVLMNLLLLEAAKAETSYAKRIGTSFGSIPLCSKTPYPPSMFQLIRFTLIEALT